MRLAIKTIERVGARLREFFRFLADRGVGSVGAVSLADYEAWVSAVRSPEASNSIAEASAQLYEVIRFWLWRDYLPEAARLPEAVPFSGRMPSEILGKRPIASENSTRRIDEITMGSLLAWSLRFVELFAGDIVRARTVYQPLMNFVRHTDKRWCDRNGLEPTRVRKPYTVVHEEAAAMIRHLGSRNLSLPGKFHGVDVQLDVTHLKRLLGVYNLPKDGSVERRFLESGLRIEPFAALVPGDAVAQLEGDAWLPHPVTYNQFGELERRLRAACLIVIAYLSGMRPGEVLSLRRGCASRLGDMWVIDGVTYKGVVDARGEKIPEGRAREKPWVVVEPVVRAIQILEELTEADLLFPATAVRRVHGVEEDEAITARYAAEEIGSFVEWVNGYCERNGRQDTIPMDPANPRISLSRFRRTLAWHICRKPRGLVAAAIQYGHVLTAVTQGYGGNAASGFPDDYSFERYLSRMEDLQTSYDRLAEGDTVSGPAADVYRGRITGAIERFSGVFITSGKQGRELLGNPLLQVYPGRGMHCVYDHERALCRTANDVSTTDSTPDITDCKSECKNIARTDGDIADVSTRIDDLKNIIADPLAPAIRTSRERAQLKRLETIEMCHTETRIAERDRKGQ